VLGRLADIAINPQTCSFDNYNYIQTGYYYCQIIPQFWVVAKTLIAICTTHFFSYSVRHFSIFMSGPEERPLY
jgi:hypothetical protein